MTYREPQYGEAVYDDDLVAVRPGDDGRFYLFDKTEAPRGNWSMSTHSLQTALDSARFSREFWDSKLAIKDDARTVRVDGEHYWIGDENAPKYAGSRGFGGSRFVIVFHDGRRVVSTNLWTQGVIPPSYRDRLPDNARFAGPEDCPDCGAPTNNAEGGRCTACRA